MRLRDEAPKRRTGYDRRTDRFYALQRAAARAEHVEDLLERLKPFYPHHDLAREWRDYEAHQKKCGKQFYAVSPNPKVFTFLKWMENAAVPIRHKKSKEVDPLKGHLELDFTEPANPLFLAQYRARHARHEN
jgi:hypothetical protein